MRTKVSVVSALCGLAVLSAASAPPGTSELRAALDAEARPAHGARVFAQCAACHGRNAGGSTDGTVPALAGQHFRYLAKQIVEFRDAERLVAPVHDENSRQAVDGPQSIADVAAYLSELPSNPRPKTGPGTNVTRGAQLYRAACQACHLDSALGSDDLGIPSLRGQHYPYLVRQIGDISTGHRVNVPADLRLLLEDIGPEDVVALADYLARFEEAAERSPEAATLTVSATT